jgi:hypothetical protein
MLSPVTKDVPAAVHSAPFTIRIKGVRRQKNRVFGTLPVSKRVSGLLLFRIHLKKLITRLPDLIMMGKKEKTYPPFY